MKKLFGILALGGILISLPFINGCKKGAEDPFLTFKSRNGRLIGTWVLKSGTSESTVTTNTVTNNDVNDNETTVDETQTNSTDFDGTNMTSVSSSSTETTVNQTNVSGAWNPSTFQWEYSFNKTESYTKEEDESTSVYTFTVEVTIDDDNTYTANYTRTNKSYSSTSSYTSGGVTTTYDSDTIYDPKNTESWQEEGDWYWLDANDDKTSVYAGPLHGKLTKLSSKEIIIDDATNDSDNTTNYYTKDLYTYNDITDGYKTQEGIETTNEDETTTTTSSSNWEKK